MTDKKNEPMRPSRRSFLIRTGIFGAVAAMSPGLLLKPKTAMAFHDAPFTWTVEQLVHALNALTVDTMKGLAAFVVPGNDAYSLAQGASSSTPGSIAAEADVYIARNLDAVVVLPHTQVLAALNALGTELEKTPMVVIDTLPPTLGSAGEWLLENLDDGLDEALANQPVRGSTVFALLLNLIATRVNPLAVNGVFLSPFARLTWNEKTRVFADLDAPDPLLTSTLQGLLPEPLRSATPAAIPSLANGAIIFGALGTYTEWTKFDPATDTLTGRPLGWDLSNYQPDGPPPKEGWPEFKGYYQGRRKVS